MTRFAERLMDHAAAVMPPERREWGAAMRAEFAALPDGREALAWAAGCVWASYCERIQPMDVFVKSLVRACAVWLLIPVIVALLFLLHPVPKSPFDSWKFARILSEAYGGMFATLWACELLIARFWSEPGKIFKKTLVRTAALWLWPLGLSIVMLTRALTDKVFRARIDGEFWPWMQHWLVNWVTHYPVIFVAIFVPLLVCELLIARRAKPQM